jgi:hypothetical protein
MGWRIMDYRKISWISVVAGVVEVMLTTRRGYTWKAVLIDSIEVNYARRYYLF